MAAYRKYSVQQLLSMLGEALQKESEFWKAVDFKPTDEIGPKHRDETLLWMHSFHEKLGFAPETFCLAVGILDRVLDTVKAGTKHLQVIGVACSFVAAKTLEEEETIPETLEIVRTSGCGCSVAELVRMERLILDKLGWDLRASTAFDFLHILLSLLNTHKPDLFGGPQVTASKLSSLTGQLLLCLCCHDILEYRPSALALSLLSLEMEKSEPEWFPLTQMLQAYINVSDSSVMACREKLLFLHHLAVKARDAASTKHQAKRHCPVRPALLVTATRFTSKPGKRKSHDEDDDEVFEAIKRLYGDEEIIPRRETGRGGGRTASCRLKLRESQSVPAAMQTVAN